MKNPALPLFVALFVAPMIACTSANAAPDPCKVATTADVSHALLSPVTGMTTRTIGFSNSCNYRSARFARFEVTVIPFSNASQARSEYNQMIASPMTHTSPSLDLSGIGDAAHRMGSMIYTLKGDTIYTFNMLSGDNNGAGAQRTIAVAKSSLSRIH